MTGTSPAAGATRLDPALRARIDALIDEGHELWAQFDRDVRRHEFHPFVAADYDRVLEILLAHDAPGLSFLEWGSATGVITIMADLLGYDACGIEIDAALVEMARELAARTGSTARFAHGSFVPAGYVWRPRHGDARTGTIEHGESGYLALGRPLESFDLVFAYPWSGEQDMMRDIMRQYGRQAARLHLYATDA